MKGFISIFVVVAFQGVLFSFYTNIIHQGLRYDTRENVYWEGKNTKKKVQLHK
jgi:hypothetical protein